MLFNIFCCLYVAPCCPMFCSSCCENTHVFSTHARRQYVDLYTRLVCVLFYVHANVRLISLVCKLKLLCACHSGIILPPFTSQCRCCCCDKMHLGCYLLFACWFIFHHIWTNVHQNYIIFILWCCWFIPFFFLSYSKCQCSL